MLKAMRIGPLGGVVQKDGQTAKGGVWTSRPIRMRLQLSNPFCLQGIVVLNTLCVQSIYPTRPSSVQSVTPGVQRPSSIWGKFRFGGEVAPVGQFDVPASGSHQEARPQSISSCYEDKGWGSMLHRNQTPLGG